MNNLTDPSFPTAADVARNRAQLLSAISTRPASERRRSRVIGAAAVATVLAAGTAGGIIITATQQEISKGAVCYGGATLDSPSVPVIGADGQADVAAQRAAEVCGILGGNGTITAGEVHEPDDGVSQWPDRDAPALGVCVGPNKVLAVFPLGDSASQSQLCLNLGLGEAPATR